MKILGEDLFIKDVGILGAIIDLRRSVEASAGVYIRRECEVDANAIPTVWELLRYDGTVYQRYRLTEINALGQYRRIIITEYGVDGVTVEKTTTADIPLA